MFGLCDTGLSVRSMHVGDEWGAADICLSAASHNSRVGIFAYHALDLQSTASSNDAYNRLSRNLLFVQFAYAAHLGC